MDGAVVLQGNVVQSTRVKSLHRPDLVAPRVRHALRANTYAAQQTRAALKVTYAGDRVLELGGGIGLVSAVLAKRRDLKHIHIYEPNAPMADYIRDTHALNTIDNATVHTAILGKRKGTAPFEVRGGLFGASPKEADGPTSTETVDVQNVKTQVKAIRPDVLICDIDGAEAALIPLMDLNKVRAAVVTLNPQTTGPEGVTAVFQAFMTAGLSYFPKLSSQKVVTFRRAWPVK